MNCVMKNKRERERNMINCETGKGKEHQTGITLVHNPDESYGTNAKHCLIMRKGKASFFAAQNLCLSGDTAGNPRVQALCYVSH